MECLTKGVACTFTPFGATGLSNIYGCGTLIIRHNQETRKKLAGQGTGQRSTERPRKENS